MKVAVIIDTWFPAIGGGQINAWEISKRLAQQGVEIDIITRNNGQDKLERVKNLYVYKLGTKVSPQNTLSKIIFLLRSFIFISRGKYDLVHAHAFLPGITARLLMVFKGIPAIFIVHGTSIGTNLNNIFSSWLEKFILTKILYSAQITVSQDFLKIKNINKNISYIPNGVDTADFDKIKVSKFKNPTLIFVGRLHPQKNLSTLIDALNTVKTKIPEINLLIVGKGREEPKLREKVKYLRLQKNIKFLGEVIGKDLIRLYKSSHIFILPSIYEGQPLTLLEAWAAKLPVIVSKTGDCQYLVKKGKNGYLINNTNDIKEISDLIIRVLKSENKEKMGQNGYNLVKQNFSWKKSARMTLKIYESL